MENRHVTLKFVSRYFYWFVTIFAKKNTALVDQKLGGIKILSKSVSVYSNIKKVPTVIKP